MNQSLEIRNVVYSTFISIIFYEITHVKNIYNHFLKKNTSIKTVGGYLHT